MNGFYASIAIVNVHAIQKTTEELCVAEPWLVKREAEIGFWTTLLHEIRHNQVDGCPYPLPWIHDGDEDEDHVEDWCREAFERLGL